MTFTINSACCQSWGSLRWRASLLSIVMLATAACAPAGSAPEATSSPLATSESAVVRDPVGGGPAGGGRSVVDSEDLIGLGELGLLPSLLQTFGTGIDCDFDDAFSTCQ